MEKWASLYMQLKFAVVRAPTTVSMPVQQSNSSIARAN
jgi:hypothetical protein